MISTRPLLAAHMPPPSWVNFLIFAGAILLVTFAAFLWFVRSRDKIRPHRHRHRRHRRRINPTLAEQGGLPPVREKEKTPTPAPHP